MTELAIRQDAGLAVDHEQSWWNDRQIAGLQQIGLAEAAQGDLLVFFHVCQRTGLDPFARQIHMVSRNAKDENDRWVKKWTIQTGIDGFRLIADRADRRDHTMREYEETLWADAEGKWAEVWTKATAPTAAKVVVIRNGKRFPSTVLYREYVQTKRNGDPTSMWFRMPANQLAKCAEAAALRKAYPQDLSGVYATEEMDQADQGEPREREPASASDRMGAILNVEQVPMTGEPEEVGSDAAPADDPGSLGGLTKKTRGHLFALFTKKGIPEDQQLSGANHILGTEYESRSQFTEDDAARLIEVLNTKPDADQP